MHSRKKAYALYGLRRRDRDARRANRQKGEVPVFAADIDGHAVFAFFAENELHAEDFVEEESLRAELTCLGCEGKPLWDGETKIRTRPANPKERAIWNRSRRSHVEADHEINGWMTFLLPVSDLDE